MADNFTPIDELIKKYQATNSTAIGPTKEAEPVSAKKEPLILQETVSDTEKVAKEVAPYVEVQPDEKQVELDPELIKAGLQPIGSDQFSSAFKVALPIADERIVQGLQEPLTSSWRWLSELAVYLLSQAHLKLKQIHGRVVRVLKR